MSKDVYLGNTPNWLKQWCKKNYTPTYPLTFTATSRDTYISIVKRQTGVLDGSFQVQLNHEGWKDVSFSELTDSLNLVTCANASRSSMNATETLKVRNICNAVSFIFPSGSAKLSGKIKDTFTEEFAASLKACQYLFADDIAESNIGLVDASKLDIFDGITMSEKAYQGMFSHCTMLTAAPVLSATGLADNCYASMFTQCTSLSTPPALPATSLNVECYAEMFSNCTSLTAAPDLVATDLADYCYSNMFRRCTGITALHYPKSLKDNTEQLEHITIDDETLKFGAKNATVYFDL